MRKTVFVVFTICLAMISTTLAQRPTADVPVTVTIKDYIDAPDLAGGTQRIQMQVQSDGAGSYKGSKSVISVIQGTGDWLLDTGVTIKTPTRKVFLDFSQPIAGSAPGGANSTAPFVTALVSPRFRSKLSQYGLSMFSIPYGQTVQAPMVIGFYYPPGSSDHYRIHCTPGEQSFFPYAETDFVDMTCTGADANAQCNRWQIVPNGAKGGCVTADCSVKRNVVKLVKVVTKGTKVTEYDQGDFYMTFTIEVTNP
ncbi:MAG TPA: hypothetical protein VNN73_07200 [Blastocatellia bacterium]|nr:hypothetical protein [Blastocatellia bacterium]